MPAADAAEAASSNEAAHRYLLRSNAAEYAYESRKGAFTQEPHPKLVMGKVASVLSELSQSKNTYLNLNSLKILREQQLQSLQYCNINF